MQKLAIHGGEKVRAQKMPPRMAFGDEALMAVKDVFDYYQKIQIDPGYQGYFEKKYTDAFVKYQGAGYADAVATGTGSLFVAIGALGLPAGSHVIVSPITDPGTLTAILYHQLIPVLADSMPDSYNIGVEQIERAYTDKVRAIVVVHAAGKAAPIDGIVQFAKKKGLLVLEDCSQSHGAEYLGQKVGTFGDIAAFSTMYRKIHATGACGGIVYTKSEELYRLSRAHADRGKPFWIENYDDKDPTQFLFPALNWNIDEISCAIGLTSLGKLDETRKRRSIFLEELSKSLRKKSNACSPYAMSQSDSPFFFPIFVDLSKLSCSKREFAEALKAEGIDINPHYMYLVEDWPWIQRYLGSHYPCHNARSTRDRSFNLLFNEKFGPQEVEDIIGAIIKVESAFIKE